MTNLKVKECRKLRYIQFKKTIQFKNAFKTVLARSETEIKGFLCLTDVASIYPTYILLLRI